MIVMINFGTIMFLAIAIIVVQEISVKRTRILYAKYSNQKKQFECTHTGSDGYFASWELNEEDREEHDRLNGLCNRYIWYDKSEWLFGICITVAIICAIALIISGTFATLAKVNTDADRAYDRYNTQYKVLEYRLSEEENALTNIDLYNAVIEYNNNVIDAQKACQNPFINIFQDQSVMKNKIIDVSKLK